MSSKLLFSILFHGREVGSHYSAAWAASCCCCSLHAANFPLREFSMFTSLLLLMGLCAAPPSSWLLNAIKGLQMLQLCTCTCVPVCQSAHCCLDVEHNLYASRKLIDTIKLWKWSYLRRERGNCYVLLFSFPLIFLSSHVFRLHHVVTLDPHLCRIKLN